MNNNNSNGNRDTSNENKITSNKYNTICFSSRYSLLVTLFLALTLLFVSCASDKEKPAQVVKVTRSNVLSQLSTTGIVIPRNRLEIKPPVAGRVEEVLVNEGQKVRKGQTLAWMSSSERAAILDAARSKGNAELKYWQEVYMPAPIVAPLSGFIIKRSMEQGQYFNTSDSVLIMADRLIVEGQVDETDLGKIRVNQKAIISLDAYPGSEVSGYVEQIAYESETINNVNIYKTIVRPESVPDFFRAGMSATVNFTLGEKDNVLTLPLNAVKKKASRAFVFLKQKDKIIPTQIQTGLENSENMEIVSGVSEGDEVVIPTAKMVQDMLSRNSGRQPFNILGGNRRR